jgi:energy-coupling factor transport system ATP-binding protein
MKVIKANSITFKYKGQEEPLFSDVSFQLERGKIAVLTGASGSGKTTMGLCFAGVIPHLIEGIFEGKVEIEGRAGMVFQDPDLQVFLPTVEDELAFAPENLCCSREETGQRIRETLEQLGIPSLRQADPARLSGGQKQLVALGGVLTMKPDLLILDETFSHLDREARKRVKDLLLTLKANGVTTILIGHDADCREVADEIFILNEGKLEPCSPKPEVDRFD